ncbi:hypothetical protein GT028_14070, partial [Streptomyces sp. SID2999]
PTGRRRRRGAPAAEELAPAAIESAETASGGTGRRRGRPAEVGDGVAAEGAVMTAAEHAAGTAASNTG